MKLSMIFFVLTLSFFLVSTIEGQAWPRELPIKVTDRDQKPVLELKVVISDSTHHVLDEMILPDLESGIVKMIPINNFGKFYLTFSKKGYKTQEVEIEYRNRVANTFPYVTMEKKTRISLWWITILVVALLIRILCRSRYVKSNMNH